MSGSIACLGTNHGAVPWPALVSPPSPRPHLLLKVSNFPHDSARVLNGLDELAAVLGTVGREDLHSKLAPPQAAPEACFPPPSPHARQLDTCRPSEQHHPSWHPDQTERTSNVSVGCHHPHLPTHHLQEPTRPPSSTPMTSSLMEQSQAPASVYLQVSHRAQAQVSP